MELKKIKHIIFDLGGVLLNIDYNLTQQAFINLGVYDFESCFSQAQQTKLFDDFETGKITQSQFCSRLRAFTKTNSSESEIIAAWNSMLLNFPKVRAELLLNLQHKFSTVLLSNTNETHVSAFHQIIQQELSTETLKPFFNAVYYSNEIGFRKPNRNAFEFVLGQHNFKAEETLFLDDSIQHIEGAKKLGIQTHHITDKPIEELFADFLA